tara:strand:+ start:3875 stop:4603 length:729 start_codon:yes stop_codon:yes gene_type:complete
MKKETYYFSHDYSCINDPKIQALIGKFGASGYGIFWRIVEMLHENSEHKIELKPYVLDAIASLFKEDVKLIKSVLDYSINICELFQKDENFIYSQRVLDNLDKRDAIKKARSEAGKRSALARSQQKLTSVKQNLTKETKGKERKLKESKSNTINYLDLLTYFNQTFKKNNRVFAEGLKSKYSARFKEGYTLNNVRLAMSNTIKDQFHRDNSFKYCTLEYFSRSATIDKFGFTAQQQKYIPTT